MNLPRPENHDPFNTERPVVFTLGLWQKVVFYPLAVVVVLYMRSWRIRIDGTARKELDMVARPRMLVAWHNRSLVSGEIVRRLLDHRRIATLISPSRMAAWEAALFRMLGFKVIRGSTTRRSIHASIEILRSLKDGDDVAVTPDGPSGPLYSFRSGATALACRAGVPLLLFASRCSSARRLKTWDRHMLPYPFATVHVSIKAIKPDDPVWRKPIAEVTAQIRKEYLEMTDDPF